MGLGNVNTTRGLSIFRSIDLDESEEEVSGRECVVFGLYASNTNVAARWLKLYNATAANTTVGTTTPVATFYLPASGASPVSFELPMGLLFDTALSAAATTGVADNDTGAPGANDVVVVIAYAPAAS